jgi:hypothetical protein
MACGGGGAEAFGIAAPPRQTAANGMKRGRLQME